MPDAAVFRASPADLSVWAGRRVVVTGGGGFLGTHVVEALRRRGCGEVTTVRQREFDLTDERAVRRLFEQTRPEVVFHLAGLVGGILPNAQRPAEFFYVNLMVGTLMLHYAWKYGARKFVAAGAGCGYPEKAPLPLKEESFWDGFPQKESAPYSLAKRLLHVQSHAYRQQYGFDSIVCIPGNLYGEHDNFNLLDAHVIPALVRKFVEAAEDGLPSVEIWGTGAPTRDFVYAGDVAEGMIQAVERYSKADVVNLSSGVETSIRDVARHLREITGFTGNIVWNPSRPDGQPRRCFDVSRAKREFGFEAACGIRAGLERTVQWYRANRHGPELRR
jgi:GDP-L-fucose synthase